MLKVFRRYQKGVFYVVAFVIICSFVFFGTFSVFLEDKGLKGKKVAQYTDNKPILNSELYPLAYLLMCGGDTLASAARGSSINLFNEGIILNEFVEKGYLNAIADTFFDSFKEEIQERLAKAKNYKPYSHPIYSHISQEALWDRINPKLMQNLKKLQMLSESEARKGFDLLVELFKAQQVFPAYLQGKLMSFQISSQDPSYANSLTDQDLSLFGFHNIEDWFGKKCVEMIASIILNGAHQAKKEGVRISNSEVKNVLKRNFSSLIQRIYADDTLAPQQLNALYYQQVRQSGLDESSLVTIWKNVLLFQKWLSFQGSQVLIDGLASEAFAGYVLEGAEVVLYELPQELQFKTFQEVAEYEAYQEAKNRKAPELTYSLFDVAYKEIHTKDLARRIPLKEILSYPYEEGNWEVLSEAFPILKKDTSLTEEDKVQLIEGLDKKAKEKLESFIKEKIVVSHADWMEEELAKENLKQESLLVAMQAKHYPFKGVKSGEELQAYLEDIYKTSSTAPIRTFDGQHYYQIEVRAKIEDHALMNFKMAKEKGVLDHLVTGLLEKEYESLKKKGEEKYKSSQGGFKALQEVKQDLLRACYAPLIQTYFELAKNQENFSSWKQENIPLDLLSKYYWYHFLEEKRKTSNKEGVQSTTLVIQKSSPLAKVFPEIFKEEIGYTSSLKLLPSGQFAFVEVKKKTQGSLVSSPLVKTLIEEEIAKRKFHSFLQSLTPQNVIPIPEDM